jgi:tRNA (guanine37-N1)-methyltransferase
MVLAVEPLDHCLEALGYQRKTPPRNGEVVVLTSAAGGAFNQATAIRYSLLDRLTIICGHYLGVDERILDLYEIEEVSVGDYILTGGEPAAAVMVDAVARLVPGVLKNFASALRDSFMDEILGAPCYTKPAEYRGLRVPEPLVSGNHNEIERFRRQLALRKCTRQRPDLLEQAELSAEERAFVAELKMEDSGLK